MKDSKNLSQQILNTNKSNSNNSCSKFMTNTVVRIPAGIPSPKVSLFENMTSVVPIEEISLWEFLLSSDYQDIVHIYRETQDPAVRKEVPPPLCDRFRNIRYTSPKKARASA